MRNLSLILGFLLSSGIAIADSAPMALVDIEVLIEKTFDLALKGEASQTQINSMDLSNAWSKFKLQAAHDGAKPLSIQKMDEAISRILKTLAQTNDKIAIATAVNEPSNILAELFAVYRPTFPTEIFVLSYIQRQFILAGSTDAFQDAEDENSSAVLIWNSISVRIAAKGNAGATLAYNYENSLLGVEKDAGSADGAAIIKESKKGLQPLNAMKGL